MGYTESISAASANQVIATGGIDEQGLIGAYSEAFYFPDSFEFSSVAFAKDIDNWSDAVQNSGAIYLGRCKFENNSEEAQFFTDAPLNINEETSAATKVLRAIQQTNSITHAELKKLDGRSGSVAFLTSKGFVVARFQDDGAPKGRPASFSVASREVPTTEQPTRYTIIDINLTDNDGDENNPCEFKVDWLFKEVEQVNPVGVTVQNESSNGSTLTAELTLTKAGTVSPLTGAVAADFSAIDEDGQALTIDSVSESGATGVYTINLTTALTTAIVSFNGIRDVANAGTLYYMNQVTIKTA